MVNDELKIKIYTCIKQTPNNLKYYEDGLSVVLLKAEEDIRTALEWSKELKTLCLMGIKQQKDIRADLDVIYKKLLLLESPYIFDSYMLYLERKRPPRERFYLPRKEKLAVIVQALQDLEDDKLDELFISQPPRTGKTTLVMFFLTWIAGKYPEISNLYSAYSDVITSALYTGILEVIKDDVTYAWKEVFPNATIAHTDAADETIDIGRVKRYPTITCRSLYGTLNGACDCSGYLIGDDLIGGIEEALNPDRLIATWSKVDNNFIPRAKERSKILWIGTRWSIIDPIGKRQDLVLNSPEYGNRRVAVVSVPALDPETDESNFEYNYGVGFSTAFYRQRRASYERQDDMASWFAQYQNEPIERDGALFTPGNMRFYNGVLPEGEPDNVLMACDVAFGGGDYLSAPVAYRYGNTVFIPDVVFDNSDKKVTRPLVADCIVRNGVKQAQFEANNGGDDYKDWVDAEVKNRKHKCTITSKMAPTTTKKEVRIYNASPDIREWYFLEEGKRSPQYSKFMGQLYSFKINGKNKNDDAPDSLAQLDDLMLHSPVAVVEVCQRPL
jgi:hypothetical protein